MMETYIIASFEYSFAMELAITDIAQLGIDEGRIRTIPLVKESVSKNKKTRAHIKEDGFSLFDLSMMFGNILAIPFTSFGFIWKGGPIVWGIIGFVAGILLGVVIKIIKNGRQKNKQDKKDKIEVLLLVKCPIDIKNTVEEILWNHNAVGLSEI